MKKYILSGFTGASILILILLAILVFWKPFNYKAIYIINPKVVTAVDSLKMDSLKSSQIAVLRDLEEKGILLTPQEYTSHISGYYSTLVAFLIGLFVLFTVGSIYGTRITSRNEIEEAKNNIKRELEKSLLEDLRKRTDFSNTITDVVKANMGENFVTKSDDRFFDIDAKLKDIEDKQTKQSEEIDVIKVELGLDSKSEVEE
jgi:hypothetical protein